MVVSYKCEANNCDQIEIELVNKHNLNYRAINTRRNLYEC